MKLGILSALWRIKKENNPGQIASENSDDQSEESQAATMGLRRSELRVLFESTFVEMERDLPVAAEDKKQWTGGHRSSNDFDIAG